MTRLQTLFYPEWERLLIDSFVNASKAYSSFLPYNVATKGDSIIFEMAVAGYPKDRLDVTVEDNFLCIVGKKDDEEQYEYKFKGLSKKNFKMKYPIGPLYEVDSVTLKDGILKIVFKQTQKKNTKKLEIK